MYIYNFNDSMNGVPMLNVDMVTTASTAVQSSQPSVTSTTNLTVGNAANTPLTPEILNSVMAMTNPLEYSFPTTSSSQMATKVSQVTSRFSMTPINLSIAVPTYLLFCCGFFSHFSVVVHKISSI